ncbi:Hypothetical protein D9617_18g034050 [Elsinoe fawcettii]|nr:Hypothetical protein D9617_18g034050 [Elsinoe fawcettii]
MENIPHPTLGSGYIKQTSPRTKRRKTSPVLESQPEDSLSKARKSLDIFANHLGLAAKKIVVVKAELAQAEADSKAATSSRLRLATEEISKLKKRLCDAKEREENLEAENAELSEKLEDMGMSCNTQLLQKDAVIAGFRKRNTHLLK